MDRRFVLGCVMFVATSFSSASAQQLRPFDEAARDPSFLKYRTALIAALRRPNIKYAVAQAAPKIMLGFGGGNGRALFRRNIAGDPKVSGPMRFWQAAAYRRHLVRMLRLGGGFLRDRRGLVFVAPYIEAHSWRQAAARRAGKPVVDPTAKWDAFETAYIIRADVPVYELPNRHAKVIRRLSYHMVRMGKKAIRISPPGGSPILRWQSIKLSGGAIGWIRAGTFYQPVDYRAAFRKIGGRWQMTRFVAGD